MAPVNFGGVKPEKQADLARRMAALGVVEGELDESFVRGRGPGGQKVNKTSVAVRLLHRPSGEEVQCDQARSQSLNRFLARRALVERLEARGWGAGGSGAGGSAVGVAAPGQGRSKAAKAAAKKKKQKARRRRRAVAKARPEDTTD